MIRQNSGAASEVVSSSALPPVSWAVAGAWLTVVALGCLVTSAPERESPTPAPLPRDGA
jgi:hypothetical protein